MKLHELLAIEGNLETQANKVRTDLAGAFEKKRHLFEEKRVVFTPSGENTLAVIETQSDIQTTIRKELAAVQEFIARSLDASYQVAETNTKARANVVLEDDAGTILLNDVPATSLLELEKRLNEIGQLLHHVPTLDPAKGFKADAQRGDGIFVAREITKTRTRKAKKLYTKYEPRVELPSLPAQTELIDEDVPVGSIQEQEWSGLLTPAEKSALLARLEVVSRAVRRARSRANDAEVDLTKKIAAPLLKYIFTM